MTQTDQARPEPRALTELEQRGGDCVKRAVLPPAVPVASTLEVDEAKRTSRPASELLRARASA